MPPENEGSDLRSDFALLNAEEPIVEEIEEETPEVVEEKPKKEKKPAPIETSEEAETPEEETEEEPKEILPYERPSLAQINEKFPDFFKTFPSLKDAFYREKQFSEIFHTPQEATSAADLAETYSVLQDDIVNGNGEKLIPALKESDSLAKFSKSFLPNLLKTDENLHWKTILPILEDAVRVSYAEGARNKNDNLKWGAYYVAQYLLGDPAVAEGKRTLVQREEQAPKTDKVQEERQQFENERYNTFKIDVYESIFNRLTGEINKGFKDEDGLTSFMKKSIAAEVIGQINETVKQDKIYQKFNDRLWKEAKSQGFRGDGKARIINASLARATKLIPSLRRKLIAEALGNSPQESEKQREKVETTNSRREPGSQGRQAEVRHKMPGSRQVDWKKTSDLDFLNDKYELKKGR